MEPIDRDEQVFPNIRQSVEIIDRFTVAMAETRAMVLQQGGTRQHKRIIGGLATDPRTFSRPIAYMDTYLSGRGQKAYVYARHKTNLNTFALKLDYLIRD